MVHTSLWGSDNCLPRKESIARTVMYLRQMGADQRQRANVLGETARKLSRLG